MTCSRCASPLEDGDLRCAICALPVPGVVLRVVGAKILRCTDCNAAVGFDATVQAPRCAFCGARMTVEQPVDPVEEATLRVPFRVDREAARTALQGWLGKRGWFAPRTLQDEAVLDELAPLCWAGWVVNARAQVAWTADSDAGSGRSAWAPHGGQTQIDFDDIVVTASRGLSDLECAMLVPYYDLSYAQAIGVPDDVSDDVVIETFDAQRSAARALITRAVEATAKTRVESHIPGRRFRNIHVACLLQGHTTDRIALPAWVMAYRFRDRPYRAIVHGQRREIVLGDSPLDRRKVAGVVLGVVLLLALIAAVILASGCGGDPKHVPIDAPSFVEQCVPAQPTFAAQTGRFAVQAALDVHVDAGGLIMVDTTSTLLVGLDLVQSGTALGIVAEVCAIEIPDVPLVGQDKPIHFVIAPETIASVGKVSGTGSLGSVDQTCATIASDPITLVLGAKVDPLATGTLPVAADDGMFPECAPGPETLCATATGTQCACDQEGDGKPGATLAATNVPIVDIDEAYVALRTTFSLAGQVFTSDTFKGTVTASLESSILACRLRTGKPCVDQDLRSVRNLDPIVSQQPDTPSTFRAVRTTAGLSCPEIVAQRAFLFPR